VNHINPLVTTPANRPPDDVYLPSATNADDKPDKLLVRCANFILSHNSDMDDVLESIRENEERFNRKFNYPYMLLNEEPFTNKFEERMSLMTVAKMEFGLIPHDESVEGSDGGRECNLWRKCRNMCRYNNGFFFKHEVVQKSRWYWRIECVCFLHYF
jgi:alpha 1,2-mannosyltransferase